MGRIILRKNELCKIQEDSNIFAFINKVKMIETETVFNINKTSLLLYFSGIKM